MGFEVLLDPKNRSVGQKLGLATLFMFTLPLAAFFVAQNVFRDKVEPDNWAGAAAIIVTNLVVAGYCISAFSEKDEEALQKKHDDDKDSPQVGTFKKRTD